MIPAYSPQARGRSERSFGTWQSRLPQELRLAAITTVEAANRFLCERYLDMEYIIPIHKANRRWSPESGRSNIFLSKSAVTLNFENQDSSLRLAQNTGQLTTLTGTSRAPLSASFFRKLSTLQATIVERFPKPDVVKGCHATERLHDSPSTDLANTFISFKQCGSVHKTHGAHIAGQPVVIGTESMRSEAETWSPSGVQPL
jgi:hypothetical protein